VSLIEAGMSGRACVATDVGSVSEVVLDGQTGRVVPTDVGALADAVLELLRDEELRERYGHAARQHTHDTFGMARLVATTEAVYDRVLGRE
jgi:glycosyltransferase involved in cell wall biosynthesis